MFPYVVRINMSVPNNVSERQGVFRRKPYFLSVTFARVISLSLLLSLLLALSLAFALAVSTPNHLTHRKKLETIIVRMKGDAIESKVSF